MWQIYFNLTFIEFPSERWSFSVYCANVKRKSTVRRIKYSTRLYADNTHLFGFNDNDCCWSWRAMGDFLRALITLLSSFVR